MPTGCVCVTPVAVAPYDSDDEALEAYEREVASRTSAWEPESSEAMPKPAAADSERTRAVDAYGFELQLTPEGARARARCAASAERRAPRWRVYRDDETDAAMRDARGRRLAKKSSVDANLTRLIRKGVPRDFRRRAWMSVSGAASRRAAAPEGHYARVLRDAENALLEKDDEKRGARRSASGPTDVPPSVGSWLRPFAAQIDLDIPRTFPENPRYHGGASGGGGRAAVRNVLLAYAAEHPQTGYCQGMNYVAAFLWLAAGVAETAPEAAVSDALRGSLREDEQKNTRGHVVSSGSETRVTETETETEETTYWLFSCLVDDVMAPEIFARDMRGTLREFRTLSLLLRSKTPQTHAHLLKHDMDLCMLQSKWLLCVFTDSFPAETTARVLDVVFAEGHKAWLRVCVAMMVAHGDAIRKAAHVPDAMAILKRAFAEQHDADALLKAAHSRRWVGAFSRQVVAKARTSAVAQLRREAEAAAKARAARESKNARRIAEGNKKGAGGGEEEAERAVSAGEKEKNDDEKKR
jgi:hypothetical protein